MTGISFRETSACNHGASFGGTLSLGSVPINADGTFSFNGFVPITGGLQGSAAIAFSGKFAWDAASGTYASTVSVKYEGVDYECKTPYMVWSAVRVS